MPLTCVIPDLHGRGDLLDRALQAIAASRPDTVILLGDYVDKGSDTRGVVARLRRGIAARRVVMLKGNHDAMMVAALRDPARMDFWLARGGDLALSSYGGAAADVPEDDIAWLDARPLWHRDRHRIYVHAGLDPLRSLETQDEATLLWKRYADADPGGFGGLHVVHGHDNRPDGPLLLGGRSNLDTNGWNTGRLVLGLFDDAIAGGPIELIEILGRPAA